MKDSITCDVRFPGGNQQSGCFQSVPRIGEQIAFKPGGLLFKVENVIWISHYNNPLVIVGQARIWVPGDE